MSGLKEHEKGEERGVE